NLAAKNTLTAADAQIVEERFQARVATINDGLSPSQSNAVPVQSVMPGGRADASASQKILTESGKTPLKEAVSPLAKTVRLRDKEHRKFVSRQPCLVCGRTPSDPHHLRFVQPYALGRRVSGEFTVPLCRVHHRDLHRQGDEAAWWANIRAKHLGSGGNVNLANIGSFCEAVLTIMLVPIIAFARRVVSAEPIDVRFIENNPKHIFTVVVCVS